MEAQGALVVVEGRIELVCPMDAAAIDDHHDLFASFTKDTHDLMNVLAELLGIKVRHNFIEDFGGPILDGPNDTEPHAARDPAPGAILGPCLPFESLLAFDLTLAQRAYGEARTLGCPPPARAGQRKAPEDGFVCIEQNDLATARLVLEGGEFKRAVGERRQGGIKTPGGAVVAYGLFFKAQRTLSRPSWTPVSRAKTVASSRQLYWE